MHWCQKWSGLLIFRTIPYRPTELILSHLRAGSPGVNPGSCCTYGTGVTASGWFKIYRKWRPFRALCCSGMLVTLLLTHPSCLTASVLSLRLWCRKILHNLILTWFQSPPLPHHLLWVGLNLSWLDEAPRCYLFYRGTWHHLLILGSSAYWGLEGIIIFLSFSSNIKLNDLFPIISNYGGLHTFTLPESDIAQLNFWWVEMYSSEAICSTMQTGTLLTQNLFPLGSLEVWLIRKR